MITIEGRCGSESQKWILKSNFEIELGTRGQDWKEVHKQLDKELGTELVNKLIKLFYRYTPNHYPLVTLLHFKDYLIVI